MKSGAGVLQLKKEGTGSGAGEREVKELILLSEGVFTVQSGKEESHRGSGADHPAKPAYLPSLQFIHK